MLSAACPVQTIGVDVVNAVITRRRVPVAELRRWTSWQSVDPIQRGMVKCRWLVDPVGRTKKYELLLSVPRQPGTAGQRLLLDS